MTKDMARTPIEIPWFKVDEMLHAGCDGTDIADVIGISADTLYRACQRDHKVGFAAYSAQKRATGEALLRQKQFQVALSGNIPMLIWLGKVRLNQSEQAASYQHEEQPLFPD